LDQLLTIEFPGEISTVPMICRRRPSVKSASRPSFVDENPISLAEKDLFFDGDNLMITYITFGT